MRKLLYIINPISGTHNKEPVRSIISSKTEAANIPFEMYPSVADGDYSFLDSIITEGNFSDIIIAGGDGTVNQVINSLHKHDRPFGIIPCGSGNGLAFSAGLPKAVDKALSIVFNGKPELTDAFNVNGQFACMLCGLGFDAQVAHDFANDRRRGLLTYIRKIIKNFFTCKTYSFSLESGNSQIHLNAYFISIANSNQFGNNFTIAPRASLRDGLLDVVIMMRQSKLSVLLYTLKQITGFNKLQKIEMINDQMSVVYFQAPSITITNHELAPLHIDGEPKENVSKLTIDLRANFFRLIYP
ncbi:MAG TPA: YegS/Rv2252/BmrU family lipid kinase [Chitinophagaceae bacterium]|jgi:YegS/Rv2252/BmrU family lipid kinase|nr:YegS/Rv2252/BmrU family lipid kinase [Chitinophagaceae bacterium]